MGQNLHAAISTPKQRRTSVVRILRVWGPYNDTSFENFDANTAQPAATCFHTHKNVQMHICNAIWKSKFMVPRWIVLCVYVVE